MKNKITILLSCLMALLCFSANADEIIPVNVHKPPLYSGEKRSPALIPVSCYCDVDTYSIVTTFTQNIGTVTITLTNETTGETSITTVDSSLGTSTIQTSGTSGSWHVEYATSGGSTYEGDFEI